MSSDIRDDEGTESPFRDTGLMSRFTVVTSPEAEQELATLLVNSPSRLQRQISDASDRIDAQLVYADLLPNFRRRRTGSGTFTLLVFPLRAHYAIDTQAKVVKIFQYRLVPRIYRH